MGGAAGITLPRGGSGRSPNWPEVRPGPERGGLEARTGARRSRLLAPTCGSIGCGTGETIPGDGGNGEPPPLDAESAFTGASVSTLLLYIGCGSALIGDGSDCIPQVADGTGGTVGVDTHIGEDV